MHVAMTTSAPSMNPSVVSTSNLRASAESPAFRSRSISAAASLPATRLCSTISGRRVAPRPARTTRTPCRSRLDLPC
eukprot:6691654-Prymnesium_polylepis.3